MKLDKLTKETLANVAADSTADIFVWDTTLPGFGIKIPPSGARIAVYQYRADGKSRRVTIGRLCAALTLDQAKRKAKEHAAAVLDGEDPQNDKVSRRNALNLGDLMDKYLLSADFAAKGTDTQDTDRGRLNNHLRPLLGSVIADKATPDQIAKARDAITAGKTARKAVATQKKRGYSIVKGGPGAARKSIKLLRTIYEWADGEGMLSVNPAAKVPLDQDGMREVIIDEKQYGALFATLDRLEGERQIAAPAADAIRLIAFTGARKGEVTGLLWRHMDIPGKRIVISKGEHKTGKKTQKPRIINLAAEALQIITRQEQRKPEDRVFAPARGTGGIDLRRPWRLVRVAAKLPADFVLHGMRHSIGSHLAMGGAGLPELKQALGHKSLQSVQRYIHFAEQARAALATKAAAPVSAAYKSRAESTTK